MAYLGGKLTQGVVGLINKITGLKRRKDEDDFMSKIVEKDAVY